MPHGSADGRCALPGAAVPHEPVHAGWQRSFRSGCPDASGRLAAGSEVLHLVPHGGRLYAANGYWMDPRNPLYGAPLGSGAWAQVLRLDSAEGAWQVDLDLPRHLRAEALHSATFTTDAQGRALPEPVSLLLVAAYAHDPAGGTSPGIHLFTRDDASGRWEQSVLLAGPTGHRGESNSVRALRVYRDRVTGVDRLFVTLGIHGVRSGVYDPAARGRVRWDATIESPDLPVRPLALAEAGGMLHLSSGSQILRRVDGPTPRWLPWFDMATLSPAPVRSPSGGIRGLSAVPATHGPGDALLFAWTPGPDSPACVFRIDHAGGGAAIAAQAVQEVCLRDLAQEHLGGRTVRSVLAAYNDFHPVTDPATGRRVHLTGLEAWLPDHGVALAPEQRRNGHGFYGGAMIAVREAAGRYRIVEVNGRITPGAPPLVAARSFARSPFATDQGQTLFVGGYDCNFFRCSDTGWVFRGDLRQLLGR